MTVLLLLSIGYRFTGNVLHEIGGVILALLFIVHNVLNRRWYVVFFKGRQSIRRVLVTLVNLLLVAAMIVTLGTGVLISATVFAPLGTQSSDLFMHDLHQGAAYASFILIAIHLGMHWEMLMAKLKNWLHVDPSRLDWVIISRIISAVVIIYGIYASFMNDIGEKLLMQRAFMRWGEETSLWGFLLDYFAIGGSYVGITHFLFGSVGRVKPENFITQRMLPKKNTNPK